MNHYDRRKIFTLLTQRFSREELVFFCYDTPNWQAVYDSFAPQIEQSTMVERIIDHAAQTYQFTTLLAWAEKHNPTQYHHQAPYTSHDHQPGKTYAPVFIDQAQLKQQIIASPPYHLVDAPAGYGKTHLLIELKNNFLNQGYYGQFITLTSNQTSIQVVQQVFRDCGLVYEGDTSNIKLMGLQLGTMLRLYRRSAVTQRGIVFFIDFANRHNLHIFDELLTEFIPFVEKSLRVDSFFQDKSSSFLVICAGRYLAGHYNSLFSPPIQMKIVSLLPFDYETLYQLVTKCLPPMLTADTISQLTTHLMFISGGHPETVNKLLGLYQTMGNLPPDEFVDFFEPQIKKIVAKTFSDFRASIPYKLQTVVMQLGVFRYLSYNLLAYLIENDHIWGYDDAYHLADSLTLTHMFDWTESGRLLHNKTLHAVLLAHWQQQPNNLKLAQQTCITRLQQSAVSVPEMWLIEYLYYTLLQNTTALTEVYTRQTFRQHFLKDMLPKALQYLVDQRNPYEEKNALRQALKRDEQFQFMINYCLRDQQYSNKPYTMLLQQIDLFFNQLNATRDSVSVSN
ncbi:hypothetical protein QUF64_14900 [Anaerolineales bacterium HSG6]|nr:hypothetical protein [Anaerolineales bacterium HSG6]MDM8530134.1 hypothetical protein [Anaerolineales bacterium HSG25]